ncbi:MAG: T9SS type A sorting domain-containing protein [Cytophagales bacterium]
MVKIDSRYLTKFIFSFLFSTTINLFAQGLLKENDFHYKSEKVKSNEYFKQFKFKNTQNLKDLTQNTEETKIQKLDSAVFTGKLYHTNIYKTIYYYNESKGLFKDSILFLDTLTNTWILSQVIDHYSSDGLNLEKLDVYDWYKDSLWLYQSTVYHYSETGFLLSETHDQHDYELNSIISSIKFYTYDDQGRKRNMTEYMLDNVTNDTIAFRKIDYSYLLNNVETESYYIWSSESNFWLEDAVRKSYFNNNNLIGLSIYKSNKDGILIPTDSSAIEYLNGKITKNISFRWDNLNLRWVNDYQYLYNYTANGYSITSEYWDKTLSLWKPENKWQFDFDYNIPVGKLLVNNFDYNVEYKILKYISFSYDTIQNDWVQIEEINYYYSELVNKIAESKKSKYQNMFYPNPNSNGKITFMSDNSDKVIVEIIDFYGRLLSKFEVKNNEKIDLLNYNRGTYLFRSYEKNNINSSVIVIE